jgi:hypothetical protein
MILLKGAFQMELGLKLVLTHLDLAAILIKQGGSKV